MPNIPGYRSEDKYPWGARGEWEEFEAEEEGGKRNPTSPFYTPLTPGAGSRSLPSDEAEGGSITPAMNTNMDVDPLTSLTKAYGFQSPKNQIGPNFGSKGSFNNLGFEGDFFYGDSIQPADETINGQPVVVNNGQPNVKPDVVVQNGQPDVVVQNGQPVVQNGQPVVQNGQPVVQNGQPVVQNGQPVVQNGQPVVPKPVVPKPVVPTTSDSAGGTSFNTYDASGAKTVHHADGSKDIYDSLGNLVSTIPAAGTISPQLNVTDTTKPVTAGDGSALSAFKNLANQVTAMAQNNIAAGTNVVQNPDGSSSVQNADGSITRTQTNGLIETTFADGSTKTIFADGSQKQETREEVQGQEASQFFNPNPPGSEAWYKVERQQGNRREKVNSQIDAVGTNMSDKMKDFTRKNIPKLDGFTSGVPQYQINLNDFLEADGSIPVAGSLKRQQYDDAMNTILGAAHLSLTDSINRNEEPKKIALMDSAGNPVPTMLPAGSEVTKAVGTGKYWLNSHTRKDALGNDEYVEGRLVRIEEISKYGIQHFKTDADGNPVEHMTYETTITTQQMPNPIITEYETHYQNALITWRESQEQTRLDANDAEAVRQFNVTTKNNMDMIKQSGIEDRLTVNQKASWDMMETTMEIYGGLARIEQEGVEDRLTQDALLTWKDTQAGIRHNEAIDMLDRQIEAEKNSMNRASEIADSARVEEHENKLEELLAVKETQLAAIAKGGEEQRMTDAQAQEFHASMQDSEFIFRSGESENERSFQKSILGMEMSHDESMQASEHTAVLKQFAAQGNEERRNISVKFANTLHEIGVIHTNDMEKTAKNFENMMKEITARSNADKDIISLRHDNTLEEIGLSKGEDRKTKLDVLNREIAAEKAEGVASGMRDLALERERGAQDLANIAAGGEETRRTQAQAGEQRLDQISAEGDVELANIAASGAESRQTKALEIQGDLDLLIQSGEQDKQRQGELFNHERHLSLIELKGKIDQIVAEGRQDLANIAAGGVEERRTLEQRQEGDVDIAEIGIAPQMLQAGLSALDPATASMLAYRDSGYIAPSLRPVLNQQGQITSMIPTRSYAQQIGPEALEGLFALAQGVGGVDPGMLRQMIGSVSPGGPRQGQIRPTVGRVRGMR